MWCDWQVSGGFVCPLCKAVCSQLTDLRRHLSHHVGDHAVHCYFCRHCDYRSTSMDDMDSHITIDHPTQPPRYEVALEKVSVSSVTHTHTHPFNGPLSGTTRVSRYQKGKTNLDFAEARDSEWQWHPLGRMQVCTSLQTDNHASTHH